MKLVKSPPRFRCDFCKRIATKPFMERHERICWANPNRYCELCDNKGEYTEFEGEGLSRTIPCYYCSQFDAAKLPETLPNGDGSKKQEAPDVQK
jgi:hypothetical protein